MGDIADQLVEDEMFGCNNYETIPSRVWVKRTPAEKKIASIRKEIALMVKSGTNVEEARRLTNLKYGKGWRDRGLVLNDDNQWSEEELSKYK